MNIEKIFSKYFNGERNFLTPHVCGFAKKQFGDEYLLIEKSKGEGIFEDLYGVTALVYCSSTGVTQRIDLSECYSSIEEVESHLDWIDESIFNSAHRYGEKKKIGAV